MGWNVLIVEDDDDISEALYDIIENRGHLVWRASNGRDAINIVTREAFHPDVVLLDLRMPVMDGVEFLRVRQGIPLLASSRVVIMTAQPAMLDEIEDTVFERLTKPIGMEQVLDAIERACRASRDAGQVDGEDASRSWDVANVKLSAMRLDAAPRDDQPEADAAAVLAPLLERPEQ